MPPDEEQAQIFHLSPELLLNVVAMLPRSDLKSLRLMNRVLCGIASSKLFESIRVRDDPRSLKQLDQIARSQIWASQVRHIEWALCDEFADQLRSSPDSVFSPSGDILRHLKLQCQYLRLLPSIKTVRFEGLFATMLPDEAPDLYVLVKTAKLQPSVIQAGNLSLEVGYGPSGYIQELSISGIAPQVEDCTKVPSPSSFLSKLHGLSSPWLRSGGTLNPLVFRTIAWEEDNFTPTRCILKDFLLHQHCFWRRLFRNPSLGILKMENVVLMSCENKTKDPLEAIMSLLRDRALDATIPVLKVTMISIAKQHYEGMISINDGEVDRWIKDQDSHWLAEKQDAFTPCPSYSDIEDSSDDGPYLGFWHSSDLDSEDESEAGVSKHGDENTDVRGDLDEEIFD